MQSSLKGKTAAVRRQHILAAAARTFAEAGYQRTTIRDVAKAAGVADGTIYNSFANKAELLLSMLDPLEEHLPGGSTQATGAFTVETLTMRRLLHDRWSALTPEIIDLLRVVMSEGLVDRAVGDAFHARVLKPAIKPLEDTLVTAGVPDASMAARAGIALFLGFSILRMLGDPLVQAESDDVPERIAAILAAMICTPGEAPDMPAPFDPVDISSSPFKADPNPTFARWRTETPVLRVRLRGPASGADEAFLVARYADVSSLLKDQRLVKQPENAGLPKQPVPKFARPLMRNMLALDDPDHVRLKRLVQTAFTPRRIALVEARTETISHNLIDRLNTGQPFDLIRDYALPLPVAVISDMLGVPDRDRLRFARWSGAIIRGGSSRLAMAIALPQIFAFLRYLRSFIAVKRADPADDLVSDLVQLEAEGDRLDQDELMAMVAILLNAGHETTTNLIGNGVLALLADARVAEQLRSSPELAETGIEEILRFAGPVLTSTHRYAREDLEIAGVPIPCGSLVLGLIASANRDGSQFSSPERLNLSRSPNRHLTFGEGGHYCAGAALARMEGKIAFRHILERMPDLRLVGDRTKVPFREGLVLSGPRECHVTSSKR